MKAKVKDTAIQLPGVINLDSFLIEVNKIDEYKEKLGVFYDSVKKDVKTGKIKEDFKFAIDPRNKDNWLILPVRHFRCKGCNNRLISSFSLKTEGYCYLCDPNITLEEALLPN